MEMNAYMRELHGNWLALDHSDQATKGLLGEKWQHRSFYFCRVSVLIHFGIYFTYIQIARNCMVLILTLCAVCR